MRGAALPARLHAQGLPARFADAEAFGAMIARGREKWAWVVRDAGITLS